MGMSGDTALIQAKRYVKKTLEGQGALKGQDGFSPTVKENPSNTDKDYRLDITDKNGTITTPNLKGADGSGSDYKQLKNKPSINGVEIDGNKTLDDLGIQQKGEYITEETDPTVPQWAKENTKPTYTASEVGADSAGSADMALSDAKEYIDNKIADLVSGAPETLDTLKELADAMEESQDVIDALNSAIGTKANASDLTSHTGNKDNPHGVTKSQVGLGNVDNTSDSNKSVKYATTAGSATKATQDASGNVITDTYAKGSGLEFSVVNGILNVTYK